MSMVESAEVEDGGSQYSLRWRASSHLRTVTDSLASLRGNGLLVDVTLSCEGRRVEAHRLLLAACSPYFQAIFAENPCPHPVIIFRNVAHDDLLAVVHFMYHGEVSVPQRKLASFLATAELLQVRGLADAPEPEDTHQSQPDFKRRKINDPVGADPDPPVPIDLSETENAIEKTQNLLASNSLVESPQENLPIHESSPASPDSIETCETINNTNDSKSKSLNVSTDLIASVSTSPPDQPGDSVISRDTSQDGDLVKFRCQLCWKGFKHPTSLTLHKDSHTGKTQCPICLRSFSRSYDMKSHLMKIHQDQPSDIKTKVSKSFVANNT